MSLAPDRKPRPSMQSRNTPHVTRTPLEILIQTINPPQAKVALSLALLGPLTFRELSDAAAMGSTETVNAINALVAIGLLTTTADGWQLAVGVVQMPAMPAIPAPPDATPARADELIRMSLYLQQRAEELATTPTPKITVL